MNLIETINTQYGREESNHIQAFFEKMSVPIPDSGEYIKTFDNDFLVLITPYAITMRIAKAGVFSEDSINGCLNPLGLVSTGQLCIGTNAGVTCPANYQETRQLQLDLEQNNFWFWDAKPQNCGYLPDPHSDQKHVVVIDPDAIKTLQDSISCLQYLIYKHHHIQNWLHDQTTLQNNRDTLEKTAQYEQKLYRHLRGVFKEIWSKNAHPSSSREKAREFLDICKIMKKQGLLVAGWEQNQKIQQSNYKNAAVSSQKYARRFPAL